MQLITTRSGGTTITILSAGTGGIVSMTPYLFCGEFFKVALMNSTMCT